MKCKVKKRKGYKFGKSGKCYVGKNALKKAKRQGRAIKVNQMKKLKRRKKI